MTESNYSYRIDPLFLRNQFGNAGKFGIPIVPKPTLSASYFDELRLIGFDKIKSDEGSHADRMVHFFLYDYKFERVWEKPDADLDDLRNYRAVLTPDFSMYTEMPEAMLLYNVFRNRWCGAYFASQGLQVIPTVNFGLPSSFDFCFEGIEKGSTVAISTYMVQEKDGREAQKDFFMAGYNEMLRRIEPETVLCYHDPFPEMTGNIVSVDYELSSWQHMEDDVVSEAKQNTANTAKGYRVTKYGGYVIPLEKSAPAYSGGGYHVVKYGGYVVQLGAGSVYGGQWAPKKDEDKRYLGESGDINHSERNYKIDTKIGDDGRAVMERHYSDAPNPKYHSNPHDHMITWGPSGNPITGPAINYWDGDIPLLKLYKEANMDRYLKFDPSSDINFESIADFQVCIRDGGEVVFTYNKIEYGIAPLIKRTPESDYQIVICQTGDDDSEAWYDTSEALLDHMIGDKKLREIITEVTVLDRTI